MSEASKPLDFQVTFGASVAIGEDTCGIGVTVDRGRMSPTVADRTFCGKRVDVMIRTTPNGGEDTNQKHSPGDAFEEIEAHADVKGYRVNRREIGFRLTFAKPDAPGLGEFAGRNGKLVVNGVEDIPDDDETEENRPARGLGNRKANTTGKDDGAGQKIEVLADPKYGFPSRLVENVVDVCSGNTIFHLEVRMKTMPNNWMKQIKGVGGESQQKLVDAYVKFRDEFPIPDPTLFPSNGAEKE